jgi:hypothetical protein
MAIPRILKMRQKGSGQMENCTSVVMKLMKVFCDLNIFLIDISILSDYNRNFRRHYSIQLYCSTYIHARRKELC